MAEATEDETVMYLDTVDTTRRLDPYERMLRGKLIKIAAAHYTAKDVEPTVDTLALFQTAEKTGRIRRSEEPLVLLVMKNKLRAAAHAVMLQHFGCKVFIATNGQDAYLRYLKRHSHKFNACFIDWDLDGVGGRDLVYYERENKGNLLFVALLPSGMAASDAIRSGADLFFRRPLCIHMHTVRDILIFNSHLSYLYPTQLMGQAANFQAMRNVLDQVIVSRDVDVDQIITQAEFDFQFATELELGNGMELLEGLVEFLRKAGESEGGAAFNSEEYKQLGKAFKAAMLTFNKMKDEMVTMANEMRGLRDFKRKFDYLSNRVDPGSDRTFDPFEMVDVEEMSKKEIGGVIKKFRRELHNAQTENDLLIRDLERMSHFKVQVEEDLAAQNIKVNFVEANIIVDAKTSQAQFNYNMDPSAMGGDDDEAVEARLELRRAANDRANNLANKAANAFKSNLMTMRELREKALAKSVKRRKRKTVMDLVRSFEQDLMMREDTYLASQLSNNMRSQTKVVTPIPTNTLVLREREDPLSKFHDVGIQMLRDVCTETNSLFARMMASFPVLHEKLEVYSTHMRDIITMATLKQSFDRADSFVGSRLEQLRMEHSREMKEFVDIQKSQSAHMPKESIHSKLERLQKRQRNAKILQNHTETNNRRSAFYQWMVVIVGRRASSNEEKTRTRLRKEVFESKQGTMDSLHQKSAHLENRNEILEEELEAKTRLVKMQQSTAEKTEKLLAQLKEMHAAKVKECEDLKWQIQERLPRRSSRKRMSRKSLGGRQSFVGPDGLEVQGPQYSEEFGSVRSNLDVDYMQESSRRASSANRTPSVMSATDLRSRSPSQFDAPQEAAVDPNDASVKDPAGESVNQASPTGRRSRTNSLRQSKNGRSSISPAARSPNIRSPTIRSPVSASLPSGVTTDAGTVIERRTSQLRAAKRRAKTRPADADDTDTVESIKSGLLEQEDSFEAPSDEDYQDVESAAAAPAKSARKKPSEHSSRTSVSSVPVDTGSINSASQCRRSAPPGEGSMRVKSPSVANSDQADELDINSAIDPENPQSRRGSNVAEEDEAVYGEDGRPQEGEEGAHTSSGGEAAFTSGEGTEGGAVTDAGGEGKQPSAPKRRKSVKHGAAAVIATSKRKSVATKPAGGGKRRSSVAAGGLARGKTPDSRDASSSKPAARWRSRSPDSPRSKRHVSVVEDPQQGTSSRSRKSVASSRQSISASNDDSSMSPVRSTNRRGTTQRGSVAGASLSGSRNSRPVDDESAVMASSGRRQTNFSQSAAEMEEESVIPEEMYTGEKMVGIEFIKRKPKVTQKRKFRNAWVGPSISHFDEQVAKYKLTSDTGVNTAPPPEKAEMVMGCTQTFLPIIVANNDDAPGGKTSVRVVYVNSSDRDSTQVGTQTQEGGIFTPMTADGTDPMTPQTKDLSNNSFDSAALDHDILSSKTPSTVKSRKASKPRKASSKAGGSVSPASQQSLTPTTTPQQSAIDGTSANPLGDASAARARSIDTTDASTEPDEDMHESTAMQTSRRPDAAGADRPPTEDAGVQTIAPLTPIAGSIISPEMAALSPLAVDSRRFFQESFASRNNSYEAPEGEEGIPLADSEVPKSSIYRPSKFSKPPPEEPKPMMEELLLSAEGSRRESEIGMEHSGGPKRLSGTQSISRGSAASPILPPALRRSRENSQADDPSSADAGDTTTATRRQTMRPQANEERVEQAEDDAVAAEIAKALAAAEVEGAVEGDSAQAAAPVVGSNPDVTEADDVPPPPPMESAMDSKPGTADRPTRANVPAVKNPGYIAPSEPEFPMPSSRGRGRPERLNSPKHAHGNQIIAPKATTTYAAEAEVALAEVVANAHRQRDTNSPGMGSPRSPASRQRVMNPPSISSGGPWLPAQNSKLEIDGFRPVGAASPDRMSPATQRDPRLQRPAPASNIRLEAELAPADSEANTAAIQALLKDRFPARPLVAAEGSHQQDQRAVSPRAAERAADGSPIRSPGRLSPQAGSRQSQRRRSSSSAPTGEPPANTILDPSAAAAIAANAAAAHEKFNSISEARRMLTSFQTAAKRLREAAGIPLQFTFDTNNPDLVDVVREIQRALFSAVIMSEQDRHRHKQREELEARMKAHEDTMHRYKLDTRQQQERTAAIATTSAGTAAAEAVDEPAAVAAGIVYGKGPLVVGSPQNSPRTGQQITTLRLNPQEIELAPRAGKHDVGREHATRDKDAILASAQHTPATLKALLLRQQHEATRERQRRLDWAAEQQNYLRQGIKGSGSGGGSGGAAKKPTKYTWRRGSREGPITSGMFDRAPVPGINLPSQGIPHRGPLSARDLKPQQPLSPQSPQKPAGPSSARRPPPTTNLMNDFHPASASQAVGGRRPFASEGTTTKPSKLGK